MAHRREDACQSPLSGVPLLLMTCNTADPQEPAAFAQHPKTTAYSRLNARSISAISTQSGMVKNPQT